MSVEFDCCECGRHIVAVCLDIVPCPPLCAHCIALPSWFEDPQLVRIIDPEWESKC